MPVAFHNFARFFSLGTPGPVLRRLLPGDETFVTPKQRNEAAAALAAAMVAASAGPAVAEARLEGKPSAFWVLKHLKLGSLCVQ